MAKGPLDDLWVAWGLASEEVGALAFQYGGKRHLLPCKIEFSTDGNMVNKAIPIGPYEMDDPRNA